MKQKEELTLVEKFEQYNGKTFCVENKDVEGFSYIKFKVVGYRENSNNYLIGKLVGNLGTSEHFKNPTRWDIIKDHSDGNNYYYVSLRLLGKDVAIKKASKKEQIVDIDINDFKFF